MIYPFHLKKRLFLTIAACTFTTIAICHIPNRSVIAAEAAAPSLTIKNEAEAFGGKRINLELNGHPGFVILPKNNSADEPINWTWYAPTFTDKLPNRRHQFIIEHLLAAHMALAGIDVGESYGSPEGTQTYSAFHDAIVEHFHLAKAAVLLPQSRGGLMLYNWATLHPDETARIAGIYPVCDLRSYPGLAKAARAYHLTEAQLAAELAKHNPIDLLAPLAAAHVPILHLHGDADKLVPMEQNSAELARRYKALNGNMTLVVIHGKGHQEVDEFFTNDRFVTFLTTGK